MGVSAGFAIEENTRHVALSAAEWLPGFYPTVTVTVGRDAIKLHSETHNESELAAIWATAFANELLFNRGRERRAAAFTDFAR